MLKKLKVTDTKIEHALRRKRCRRRSPTATRFQATSRRRARRAEQGADSGTPRDRARERRGATRAKAPGAASRASGRVRSGRAPVPQLLGAANPRGSGRAAAEAGDRGPGCVRGAAPARRPPPRRTPSSQASGVVHARVAGRRCGRHSPGSRGRGPGSVAPPGKTPAAAAAQLPNSRSCACETAIAETPSFPSFKPPANGGAEPREPACSRLPRGPPGRPRTRMRTRTRTCTGTRRLPRGSVWFLTACGSEVSLSFAQHALLTR